MHKTKIDVRISLRDTPQVNQDHMQLPLNVSTGSSGKLYFQQRFCFHFRVHAHGVTLGLLEAFCFYIRTEANGVGEAPIQRFFFPHDKKESVLSVS